MMYDSSMPQEQTLTEKELARMAKRFRREEGITRAQAAREMGVSQTSIFQAEEKPEQGLMKLRIRMIEAYSTYNIKGPIFLLERK